MVRVVLTNELPVGTVIHWHGIRHRRTPMDGVPPFTQPADDAGRDVRLRVRGSLEPAVGIYHSHNGADQVLDGLFGAITIGEMQTPQELLERGFAAEPDQSINMVLNDAGVIGLTLNGKGFPATEAYTATVGDTDPRPLLQRGSAAAPDAHAPAARVDHRQGRQGAAPADPGRHDRLGDRRGRRQLHALGDVGGPASSAPRKMPGNASTLLIWLG
jgi:hypothetical protein